MKPTPRTPPVTTLLALAVAWALTACNSPPLAGEAAPARTAAAPEATAAPMATPFATPAPAVMPTPAAPPAAPLTSRAADTPRNLQAIATQQALALSAPVNSFEVPTPVPFDEAIARSGTELFSQAAERLGAEQRTVVIDPLIDGATGAQTVSTEKMGVQLESIIKARHSQWQVKALTRQALADKPLLLIGTLTPVNTVRAVDTPPDVFRVWVTLIDLRDGRVIAKQIDSATVASVNNEPLKYFADSPTWHKDKTVLAYINSCQRNTRIGDPADPEYLARLPAAAVMNEAMLAYGAGHIPAAQKLYQEAAPLADPGDLRVLNGLYLTSWQLGQKDAARKAFDSLVGSGLEQQRLPVKLLFQPGKTSFAVAGDLQQQYQMWIASLAQQAAKTQSCVRVVGHTSRTGGARGNEVLSRQRAEAVQRMLEQGNRGLGTRLTAAGVGSREALVGLGTDDQRDALDRRVEFRVVDCI